MNVADIQVFGKVAATRNFSEAAVQLGITRSAVSKSVSRLENELGVTLINRSPRSASLTEAGRNFLQHAMEIDAALERAVASVSGADQLPGGNVACSLPTSLGAALMPSLMHGFRQEWPDVTLSLHFDDHCVDLIGSGIDVAIRVAQQLEDSTLGSQRLASTTEVLVASPRYLETHGTPRSAAELKEHRCLALGNGARQRTTWRFDGDAGSQDLSVPCATTSNSILALVLAACMDDGILYVPELFVSGELEQGLLVPVMPELSNKRRFGVFAVCANPKPPAKIRVFIEFVEQVLPELDTLDRWSPLAGDRSATPRRRGAARKR